jgi:putative transposase
MLKNRSLARAISDVGMQEFRRQMSYKTHWCGSDIAFADRWYPSSKRCSRCGTVKDELPLSQRTYRCDVCSLVIDRDLNAARNLAQLAPTASSAGRAAPEAANACGEDVRPANVGPPSLKQEPNRNPGSA